MENLNSSGKRERNGNHHRNNNKRNAATSRKNGKAAWIENKLNRQIKATNSNGVIERHKGSYNLDVLKETASYVSQIAYLNALYPTPPPAAAAVESSANEKSDEIKLVNIIFKE